MLPNWASLKFCHLVKGLLFVWMMSYKPSTEPMRHTLDHNSMGDSNTVVSAYTMYRHLQQYCSHPSICR